MTNCRRIVHVLISCIILVCMLVTSACSQRDNESSAENELPSFNSSEYDSYSETNNSDSHSDRVSKSSLNDPSYKKTTNKNITNKEVKNTKATTKITKKAAKTKKLPKELITIPIKPQKLQRR